MTKLLVLWTTLGFAALAHGQDARDDDIFGSAAPQGESKSAPAAQAKALMDTMQIGGRLELRSVSSQAEHQRFQKGPFISSKTADLYFDTRPSDELRVFLRTRLAELESDVPTAIPGQSQRVRTIAQSIDELWFKGDLARAVFLTYGKQHLKWGSGRIWNPTDFTAREARDPFELFDRRLGQQLLKIHVPNEKLGFNYYAVLQFDDAERTDDIGLALRGEFAFLGQGELALTAQTRRSAPQRLGVDVSSALGPIDVNVEAAFSRKQSRTFYKDGDLQDGQVVLPTPYQDTDKLFKQVLAGINYAFKYNDEDSIFFGAESFYNELGYDERFPELYALVLGQAQNLYAARRYLGAYVRLPTPGDWNKTSFYVTGLRNLSDKTISARLTATWTLAQYATLEAYASRCFGDYGEFCFKIPQSLVDYSVSPGVDPQLQRLINLLPTRKTVLSAGLGLSMNF